MKKRFLCTAITTLLILALLPVSCALAVKKVNLDPKKPVTVSLWHYYIGNQKDLFDQMVEEFNSGLGFEMGIIIDAQSQGSIPGLIAQVTDSISGKAGALQLPNVFASYADTAYLLYKENKLTDLKDYLTQEELAQFVSAYIDEAQLTAQGAVSIFPIAKSTEALFVNHTAWALFAEETGANTDDLSTWEGLCSVSKAYYEWSGGKAFYGRDAMANYLLVGTKQLGHELFTVLDEQAQYDLDHDTFKKLWECYYVPYVSGHFAAIGRFRSDDAKTGDIAAFVGSTSGATYFPREVTYPDGSTQAIEGAVYSLPNFEGTTPMAVQQGAGMVVTKSDDVHEYAATVFLKWFVEPEHNVLFSVQTGYLPVTLQGTNAATLSSILNASGLHVNALTRDTVNIGLTISNTYGLYTSKPFDKGDALRSLLTDCLSDECDKGLQSVQALIESGIPYQEAVAQFTTDDVFENWYMSVIEAINAL